jgi:hypothetical protein
VRPGIAKFRHESVRIDVFNVETLNAGQMSIGEKLRRHSASVMPRCRALPFGSATLRTGLLVQPTRAILRRSLAKHDLTVFFSSLPLTSLKKVQV